MSRNNRNSLWYDCFGVMEKLSATASGLRDTFFQKISKRRSLDYSKQKLLKKRHGITIKIVFFNYHNISQNVSFKFLIKFFLSN